MTVVLDTCAIVWAVSGAGQFSPRAVCRPTRNTCRAGLRKLGRRR